MAAIPRRATPYAGRIRAWLERREKVLFAPCDLFGRWSFIWSWCSSAARCSRRGFTGSRKPFAHSFPPNRRRAVSPFRGPLAADARAGRALAADALARRDLLARNRPGPTSRPVEKLSGGLLLGFVSLAVVAGIALGFRQPHFHPGPDRPQNRGNHFQRHRDGGQSWPPSRKSCFAAAFLAVCAGCFTGRSPCWQQRDLRARAFSSAHGTGPARSPGIPD
jgi:hypothetical protein